jgi:N-acetylglutamate synthase/N-acetylornithine aminotransferase
MNSARTMCLSLKYIRRDVSYKVGGIGKGLGFIVPELERLLQGVGY